MSRRVKVVVTVAAVCLPAATYCVFSPRSALTAVPLLLGATAAGARILFVVLPPCRCSARASHAVVLLSCLGLSLYVALPLLRAETAADRFARLLMGPAPETVRFLDAHGRVSIAGGYESVLFSMEPGDFEQILRAFGFREHTWEGELEPHVLRRVTQYGIAPAHVHRREEEAGYRLLIANREKTRACLYRFRL